MNTSPRLVPVAALAACLSLIAIVGACTDDAPEPATYLPQSGAWTYEEIDIVSNTCDDNLVPDAKSTFGLDYDEGNSFQFSIGDDIVVCTIDGEDFDCPEYVVSSGILDFEVTISWRTSWAGEFTSETEAVGVETLHVTCEGPDCSLLDETSCARVANFEAFAN